MQSPFNGQAQWAWDATSLTLFETCPRKYYYKMIEGWGRKTKSVHLLFGGWYATALEHYYKYRALGDTSEAALLKVVRETMVATWEVELVVDPIEYRLPQDLTEQTRELVRLGAGRPWQSDDSNKTRETLIRSIVWYVDQFEDESIEIIHLEGGKPAVELSFKFELDDGIVLCGHLDRLVRYADELFVMDQKTTKSTINSRYFDGFNPHTQMSLYTLAGQVVFGALVRGVIIDAAQIAVGFTRFERGFTFRSKEELDEFISDTRANIEEAHKCAARGYWPKRTTSCGDYGGCEYRGICARSPKTRAMFLKGDFVKGEIWNPLKSRS